MSLSSGDFRPEALLYFRERARLAHLDGNGVLVNHLAAIALDETTKLQNSKANALPVSTWAWSTIFAMFWLTDSYMLDEVENKLKDAHGTGKADEELLVVLKGYCWLVRQPLDYKCEKVIEAFKKAKLHWAHEQNACEFDVLLIHCVELLWYRNPRDDGWSALANEWATIAPKALSKQLLAAVQRLRLQVSMVVLGAPAINDLTIDSEWDTYSWVPRMWRSYFDCNYASIETILSAQSPRYDGTATIARMLFDMRHQTRLHGVFGDPQAIGLTRRRLMTSTVPELVFEEIRKEVGDEVITELYLAQGGAWQRFFGFTLAMLLELSALRRWDLG